MIWNDLKISTWAASGGVTPFDAACVNPASLDLRLGNKIRFPQRKWEMKYNKPITMKTPPEELWDKEITFDTIIIPAHGVALCCSLEYITMPPDASGTLMSKSSTGRRLFEHLHSGFFECSFFGQATFEFINDGPWDMQLFVGDRLVQLKLEQMIEQPSVSYAVTGHYNGQLGAMPHVVVGEPSLDWDKANNSYVSFMRNMQEVYGVDPSIEGTWPIYKRFAIDGERTQELYDAMMKVE